jgi:RES domain-containing protein
MVYTATSLSLAALELFVHLEPEIAPRDLVYISAHIPDELRVERIEAKDLPSDWRTLDRGDLRQLGAKWASSGRSVALQVPSAVIAGEWNVLLNPAHPNFSKVRIDSPQPFTFDERMFRR